MVMKTSKAGRKDADNETVSLDANAIPGWEHVDCLADAFFPETEGIEYQ